MKKIVALFLAVCMIFSFQSIAFAAEIPDASESVYLNDIQELNAIGIMTGDDKGNFNPAECLTRAEFAKIVCAMEGIDFDVNVSDEGMFPDLPASHWANKYIYYVATRGYMVGGEDGMFRPEEAITGTEAMKVLVSLLGYDYKAVTLGGYPTGYETAAIELNMTKGLDIVYSDFILREEVAKLVNNTLDVPIVENIGVGKLYEYEIDPAKTLLTERLDMQRDTGIVTATDAAGIRSNNPTREGRIQIDGIQMKADGRKARNYLGHKVRYIYSFDAADEDNNQLVYIQDYNTQILKISHEDYLGFADNKLTYEVNEEKNAAVSISKNADYVVNGDNVDYYDGIFDDIKLGDITLISSTNSSVYDMVSIKSYQVFIAGVIGKDTQMITDKYEAKTLNLGNDHITYYIEDYNGNALEFSSIQQDNILTVAMGNTYSEIYVGTNKVTGEIETMTAEDEMIIGENTYVKNYYAEKNSKSFAAGDKVSIYRDYFGNIADIKKEASDSGIIAYLVALDSTSYVGEETVKAKLFMTDGSFAIYEFADNTWINGELFKKITKDELITKISYGEDYDQAVSIRLMDSKIKEMDTARTPAELQATDEDGLCYMYERKSRLYLSEPMCYDFQIFVSSSTPYMVIPENIEDATDKDFKTTNYTAYGTSNKAYTLEAYTLGKDSLQVELVIARITVSSGGSGSSSQYISWEGHDYLGAVTSVSQTVNANGDVGVKLTLLKGSLWDKKPEIELFAYESDELSDEYGYSIMDVQVGDIIKILYDDENRLQKFQMYYRCADDKILPTLHTSATNKYTINRIIQYEIQDIKQGYILLCDPGETTTAEMQKLSAPNIVVIKRDGDNVSVKLGDASDLVIGDTVLLQLVSRQFHTIFVWK